METGRHGIELSWTFNRLTIFCRCCYFTVFPPLFALCSRENVKYYTYINGTLPCYYIAIG